MAGEVDKYLEDLRSDGHLDSHGKFTIDISAWRLRQQTRTLTNPTQFVLKLAQGAYLAGANYFEFKVHARYNTQLRVTFPNRLRGLEDKLFQSLTSEQPDPPEGGGPVERAVADLLLGLQVVLGLAPRRFDLTVVDDQGLGFQLTMEKAQECRCRQFDVGKKGAPLFDLDFELNFSFRESGWDREDLLDTLGRLQYYPRPLSLMVTGIDNESFRRLPVAPAAPRLVLGRRLLLSPPGPASGFPVRLPLPDLRVQVGKGLLTTTDYFWVEPESQLCQVVPEKGSLANPWRDRGEVKDQVMIFKRRNFLGLFGERYCLSKGELCAGRLGNREVLYLRGLICLLKRSARTPNSLHIVHKGVQLEAVRDLDLGLNWGVVAVIEDPSIKVDATTLAPVRDDFFGAVVEMVRKEALQLREAIRPMVDKALLPELIGR